MQTRRPAVRHLIEVLDARAPLEPPPARLEQQSSMLFDGCLPGRGLELYDATRRVLALLFDTSPDELSQSRDQETCCGARGLYPRVDPAGSRGCATALLEQARLEGGEALVCASSECAAHLRHASGDDWAAIDLLEVACLAYEIELGES